jgi:hypothetical protein
MDGMTDTATGNLILWRRLEAYAEFRLSPDLATSSRLRARVLAVAHRHADLARADAGLTLLSRPAAIGRAPQLAARAEELLAAAGRRRRRHLQRVAAVVLAASLGAGIAAGGALAARPSGPLYEARLWAETLTLPGDPSARALAELHRLEERLREATEASRTGDANGVMAALAAYGAIMDEASAAAILAGDEVAAAVLQTGVGHNVDVLQALIGDVPEQASLAISRALDAALARSAAAVDRIDASRPDGGTDGSNDGGAGQPASGPAAPSNAPAAKPTAAPTPTPTPKPKPTHEATPKPTKAPNPGQGGEEQGGEPPSAATPGPAGGGGGGD